VPYRTSLRSGCGVLESESAQFCYVDNTVSYDEVFLTALTRLAAVSLGTDGDYAAVVALAHEVGHAIRYAQQKQRAEKRCRLNEHPGRTAEGALGLCIVSNKDFWETGYDLESQADCYAGAITKHFKDEHLLDPGDFEEGQFILGVVADQTRWAPTPAIKRIIYSHGNAPDRQEHFEVGYRRGVGACIISTDLENAP